MLLLLHSIQKKYGTSTIVLAHIYLLVELVECA
jgi:hypothetical protein